MSCCYSSKLEEGSCPPLAVLFKGEGSRSAHVVSGGGTMVQWAQRGSYRACNVAQYMERTLPMAKHEEGSVAVLLDWCVPHLHPQG